jgi:hypothetical protein
MALVKPNDFAPATVAESAKVDANFDLLYNLLNGTSTDQDGIIRLNHATLPVLRVDQLGAGPILQLRQNLLERFRVDPNGDVLLTGEEMEIVGTTPHVRFNRTPATARIVDIGIDGADHWGVFIQGVNNPILIDLSTGVVNFIAIPVGPNSDPTTGNQFTRKTYVDNKKTWWSMNWFIADPSTYPLNSFNLAQKVSIPAGSNSFRAQFGRGIFNTGSASGSFSVEIRKHVFNNQNTQTTLGTVTFNPGSLGVGQGSVAAIDHTFTADDWVYIILTARSSPLQRDVTISLQGFQLPT